MPLVVGIDQFLESGRIGSRHERITGPVDRDEDIAALFAVLPWAFIQRPNLHGAAAP